MARNIKRFQLTGIVGKADFTAFKEGGVLNFSVAYSESKKINDEWVKETEWFNCSLWNPTEYDKNNIVKGVKVMIDGKPKSNTKDNITYWNWIVENVDYVFSKDSAQPTHKATDTNNDDKIDDDVPF